MTRDKYHQAIGRSMMATGHQYHTSHLSHEQQCGNTIQAVIVVGSDRFGHMPNYIEPAGANLALHTTMAATVATINHQSQESHHPLSICRQPYRSANTQTTAQPFQQSNANTQDQWSEGTAGSGPWLINNEFHIGQDRKQTQTNDLYHNREASFRPLANYSDSMRSQEGTKLAEVSCSSQQQQHHHLQYHRNFHDHHQHHHHYCSSATNQAYANYNLDEYNNQSQQTNYQQDTNHRYHHQTATTEGVVYQDNQTQAFNQIAPISDPPSSSSPFALYHYHQNYTPSSRSTTAKTATTSRFTFDGDRHLVDPTTGLWVSHPYHESHSRLAPSHHHHHHHQSQEANNSAQANSWSDKTSGGRLPNISAYQNHDSSTYDYYGSNCVPDQAYPAEESTFHDLIARGNQQTKPMPVLSPATTNTEPRPLPEKEQHQQQVVLASSGVDEAEIKPPVVGRHVKSVQQRSEHELRDESLVQRITQQDSSNNNSIHSQPVRLNQCRICGRHYARPSTLKTHLRTHTNERPYKCAVCCKTFSQAANLTAHQRVHTGERPFPCPICGRQFSQSSSVITHLRTHSGERPYRCNMCNRTFSDSSTLTKHCRIHSGEKPYQCDYCPMNFSQSGNLSRHLRLHSMSSSNKAHPTSTATITTAPISTTTGSAPDKTVVASSITPKTTTNQRNHSASNSSSSPESTLSNYSISSPRVSQQLDHTV